MAVTPRERNILIIAVLAVALLIADKYVLSPALSKRSETKQTLELLRSEVAKSQSLLKRCKMLGEEWNDMKKAGLTDNPEKAVSDVLRFLRNSSEKNQLALSSIQPERLPLKQELTEIDFTLSGTGTIIAVTGFLLDIETAAMPVKIKSLQLGAGDEYASKMSLQIKLSSICDAPSESKKEPAL